MSRARKHPSYVNVAIRSLTNSTIDTVTLVATADSPDSTLASDGTNIARVENDSIVRGSLVLNVVKNAGSAPQTVSAIVYKDAALGGIADVTDPAGQILAPANTSTLYAIKKNTKWFRRFIVTVDGDKVSAFPKFKALLRDGDSIKIALLADPVTNQTCQWTAYGRIWSRQV